MLKHFCDPHPWGSRKSGTHFRAEVLGLLKAAVLLMVTLRARSVAAFGGAGRVTSRAAKTALIIGVI